MIAYAGIGSRKTPQDILEKMKVIGFILAHDGLTLRSGGAEGADSAFEKGATLANGKKEIFLPWKSFNGNESSFFQSSPEAFKLASELHPAWNRLSPGAKALHTRNTHQILGQNLDSPCLFVVCYCNGTGGTMQALRLALDKKIPIINLANLEKYNTLLSIFVEINSIIVKCDKLGVVKNEISTNMAS